MEYARTALGPVPLSPVRGLVRKEAIMASTHTPEETRAEVSGSDVAQELQELAETLTTLGDVGNKIVNHRAHLELLADVDADEGLSGASTRRRSSTRCGQSWRSSETLTRRSARLLT